jgi:hypothetical protein
LGYVFNAEDVDCKRTYELMGAEVLREIPLLDASRLVAGYEFALVWMHADIVDYTT